MQTNKRHLTHPMPLMVAFQCQHVENRIEFSAVLSSSAFIHINFQQLLEQSGLYHLIQLTKNVLLADYFRTEVTIFRTVTYFPTLTYNKKRVTGSGSSYQTANYIYIRWIIISNYHQKLPPGKHNTSVDAHLLLSPVLTLCLWRQQYSLPRFV